jgi:hypothetical protein
MTFAKKFLVWNKDLGLTILKSIPVFAAPIIKGLPHVSPISSINEKPLTAWFVQGSIA